MKTFLKLFGWVIWKRKEFGFLIALTSIIAFGIRYFIPYFYQEFTNLITQDFSESSQTLLLNLIITYAIVLIIQWIFWRLMDFSLISFEGKGMRDIEQWAFEIITKQHLTFFQNEFTGGLVKKIGRVSRAFESLTDWFLFSFLNITLNIVISCVLLFSQNTNLGIIFIIWSLLYIVFITLFSIWHLSFIEATAKADTIVGGLSADIIGNIPTVFSNTSEEFEKNNIKNATENAFQKRKKTWILGFISFGVQGIFFISIECIALYIFFQHWQNGTFNIGLFVLFQSVFLSASTNLWNFGHSLGGVFTSLGDIKEFEEILDKTPKENPQKINTLKLEKGEISFENVSFGYENTKNIFENFTLKIPAGKKIAIVGPSGSGKSTLLKFLFDFISPHSGVIKIDKQDISKLTNQSLRNAFSFVSQTTDLFHRSLRDNIVYNNLHSSDEKILEAVKNAQCEDFISDLPQKLETLVGERGVKLSGGEKQRVAIARAFLKNSPIIILDEPTSALDSITESKIQKAITKLLENKTAIVIAHRLSTIFQMDIIVVLDKGKIVEMGTHAELITQQGKYAQMWKHQNGDFLGDL